MTKREMEQLTKLLLRFQESMQEIINGLADCKQRIEKLEELGK